MAGKNKKTPTVLPSSTIIEIISKNKQGKTYKIITTYADALQMPKKKGWTYDFFQEGFSAYPDAIVINKLKKSKKPFE